jgi:hypothetical protein
MAGILDRIFGNSNNQQVNQPPVGVPVNPQMNPQGQQVASTNISSPANPNVPSGVAAPAHSQEQVSTQNPSPLDGFKDLWNPVTTPEGATAPTSIVPQLDPAKLNEAVSKANFLQGVSPELMTKAMSGDAAAFAQVLNESSKAAFQQALLASRNLTETSLNSYGERQKADMPGMVKSQMVRDTLQTNPLYQHEATRPLLAALETQLSQKYPMASANEITQHAQNYIDQFVQVASPKQQQQEFKINRQDDFSGFM